MTSEGPIATAATNHNTRHLLVTASHAMTMHKLTGGRYVLGLGRGIPLMQDAFGIPRITTAQMEDAAGLLRRLWKGEVILGHQGPAGSWPVLHLGSEFDEDIPLLLVAFGPESLKLGGRAFDHVVLHTFFTDETTERAVRTVKDAAEQAGRDPASVTVWSCFATVGDHLSEEVRLRKTVGRLAGYLQGYGDLLGDHGWDPAPWPFRADGVGSFAAGPSTRRPPPSSRAHRHPPSRGVVGLGRHRVAGAVRGRRPRPVRARRRCRHPPRRLARRAGTRRRRLRFLNVARELTRWSWRSRWRPASR